MDEKKEYIERGALVESLKKQYGEELGWQCTVNMSDVGMMIEDAPAADVVEVRHGYWKWETKIEPQAQNRLYCSICDNECLSKGDYYVKSKYCPHCGAKMDGGKEQT